MRAFNYKYVLIFFILMICNILNFQFNYFEVLPDNIHRNFQNDSDGLVAHKLIYNSKLHNNDSKFLGIIDSSQQNITSKILIEQYDQEINTFYDYTSSFGLQQYLLQPIWDLGLKLFKSNNKQFHYSYKLIQLFVSILNAIVFSLFICWLIVEFTKLLFPLIFIPIIYYQDWLIMFGNSVYWQLWSWFLPTTIMCWFLKYHYDREIIINNFRIIIISLFVSIFVFIKCLMGYEYITSILITTTLPIFYYGLLKPRNEYIKIFCLFFIFSISSVFLSIFLHYLTLEGSGYIGSEVLYNIINKRTHLTDNLNVKSIYTESLNVTTASVLIKYLYGGGIYQYRLLSLWLLLIIFFSKKIGFIYKKFNAMAIVIFISLTAPLSWFILAKPHSYIHGMNLVLWYLPVNLFIYTHFIYMLELYIFNKYDIQIVSKIDNKVLKLFKIY